MNRKIFNPKSRKLFVIAILIILIFLLGIFLYSTLIDFLSIMDEQDIYAKIIVGNRTGFDVNGTALIFGMVVPGSSSNKDIFIKNNYDREVNIEVYVDGEISDFLKISENDFILSKNEEKVVGFLANVPSDAKYGTYEGVVKILIRNSLVKKMF